jgi:3-hydroxyisobutyrate dehydrogenase
MSGSAPPRTVVAILGFGDLGSALGARLAAGGADVRAWVREHEEPDRAAALAARMQVAGVRRANSAQEAVAGAAVVVAAVPAAAGAEVLAAALQGLEPHAVYADPAPLAPEAKAAAAERVAAAGGRYADVAVLGTTVTDGARVPMVASGPGSVALEQQLAPHGLHLHAIDGAAGQASLLKLVRSVYTKGRDALVLETLLAARRHGLEAQLLASLDGTGEHTTFPELAERILCSLAVSAGRRADELDASARVLESAAIDPVMARAGADRLRRLADAGVREHFHGERPGGLAEALATIDQLSRPDAPARR